MMRTPRSTWLARWTVALGLLLTASAAAAQPCCECRCPGNETRACSEDFGLDEDAFFAAVCEPLGCTVSVCTDRSCAQSNRCPRSEEGLCADFFDNDGDGSIDCDDPDCADSVACTGAPSPTPPPVGTPAATQTRAATHTPATNVTPGGERDCCVGRESAGCEIAACESCVCDLDVFCCDEAWDTNCAAAASIDCAGLCQCGAATTLTPTPTPTPVSGATRDCCTGREAESGPGCELPDCESCVCALDDFCCREIWDQNCADAAAVECPADCACEGAPSAPTPTTPGGSGTPPPPTTSPAAAPTTAGNGDGGGENAGEGCVVQQPASGNGLFVRMVVPLLLWMLARRRERAARTTATDGGDGAAMPTR